MVTFMDNKVLISSQGAGRGVGLVDHGTRVCGMENCLHADRSLQRKNKATRTR